MSNLAEKEIIIAEFPRNVLVNQNSQDAGEYIEDVKMAKSRVDMVKSLNIVIQISEILFSFLYELKF